MIFSCIGIIEDGPELVANEPSNSISSTAKEPCTSLPLAEDRQVFTKVVEASDTVCNSGLDYDLSCEGTNCSLLVSGVLNSGKLCHTPFSVSFRQYVMSVAN